MIEALEAQGHTYVIDDGVYFDVSTFPRYAEFAGLDLDELETSGRVERVEAKRHPADFALWKLHAARRGAPAGVGLALGPRLPRLAHRVLGHGRQVPRRALRHPHRRHRPRARSTTPTRWPRASAVLDVHPWVQVWMHNEFLDLGGEKVSKSKGHVLVVDSLVERGIDPLAFRYFFFQAHYRQQQSFTWEALEAAATALAPPHGQGRGGARRRRRARSRPRRAPPAPLLGGAGRRPQRARRRSPRCGTR